MDTTQLALIAKTAAMELVVPGYIRAAYTALTAAQGEVKAAEAKGIASLEEEAKKQAVVMEFQLHQARVAQEIAIAERIAASHEVEIEEFYDGSGKAQVGLSADARSASLGASGEGRRVTKRVIRFAGWQDRPQPAPAAADAARQGEG